MENTVLISGGSRGIGRATAVLAAKAGWQVAITYRTDQSAAEATVDQIRRDDGVAMAVKADVTSESDVVSAFDSTLSAFGKLDAVVVNAGIVGPKSTLADMTLDRMKGIVDTNVMGALLCAREAARRVGYGGSIVLVSSIAARLGSPGEYVDYAATKGAVDTLTVGLSKELAPRIRVNGVRPGIINTDIHASGGQPARAEQLGPSCPMQRAGEADEMANAIVWLLGREASYCTGTIVDVTGGR